MRPALAALALAAGVPMFARSDEGMWLLNDPPRERLRDAHNFHLTDDWLARAMRGSVRFTNGGSGGFVSPRGLIVTNHHIAADSLQKLSRPDRDLLRDGFLARTPADELPCPDLELNVLQSIDDVTARVNAAVKPGATPSEAVAARRAVMATIEKESLDATGFRSDVVTLYNGGLYHLYRYKKYTDVRLVFAPEQGIAAFGGDVDNFEYPRHSLDVAFVRAYENGAPAAPAHFFRWSPAGPAEGDLVFVTGHPGTTQRLETLDRLLQRRDRLLPYTLGRLRALEAALIQFGETSPEARRQAATDLHRVANARKAFSGQFQGLLDPSILKQKAEQQEQLRAKLPESGRRDFDAALARVAAVQREVRDWEKVYLLYERGDAFASELFGFARHLVRMGRELPKPSAQRLREYRDSNLESLRFQLFSPAPVEADVERVKLAASLTYLCEQMPADHPAVAALLAGEPPARRAAALVAGTKLFDPAERKKLADGGRAAVDASADAMVRFASAVEDALTKLGKPGTIRQWYEESVEEPERQAYAALAAARFAALGKGVAPDATFTLRLAFGVAKGYEVDGKPVPARTTFAGAFDRSELMGGREPFGLPPRWREARGRLEMATPLNFCSTADTIGGNSGSPVLNRAGELVGVNFDRNRHGLVRNFVYTDVQARHVAVHSAGVLAALRGVYGAAELAEELGGK